MREDEAIARQTAGAMEQTEARASRLGLVMGGLGTVAKAAGVGLIAMGGGLGIAGLGSVKLAADMEQTRIAFSTMLGGAEQANSFIQDLYGFAAKTPFEFVGLKMSAQQFLAFGFNASQVIPILTAVGDAVSALGGGQEMIDRVTYALGQMRAKGKVSAEEMMQLTEAGIPAWEMLANSIGVSVPEAMKMAEKGTIDASKAIDALTAGMEQRYGGMMAKQSATVTGIVSNIKDSVTQAMVIVGEQVTAGFDLKGALNNVLGFVGGVSKALQMPAVQQALQTLMSGISGLFAPLGNVLQGLGGQVTSFLQGLGSANVKGFVDTIGRMAPALGAAGGALAILGGSQLPVVGQVIGAINPLLGAFLGLLLTSPQAQAAVGELLKVLVGLVGGIGQQLAPVLASISNILGQAFATLGPILAEVAGVLADAFLEILQAVAPLLPELLELASVMISWLAPVVMAVIQAVKPLIPVFVQVVSVLAQALLPILPVVAGLIQSLTPILLQVVQAVTPLIVQLGQMLGPILQALTPVLRLLVGIIAQLAPVFLQVVMALLPLLPPLVQLIQALLPVLIPLIQLLAQVLLALAPILTQVLVWLIQNLVLPALKFLIGVIQGVVGAVTWMAQNAGAILSGFWNFVTWLFGQIAAGITWYVNLWRTIVTTVVSALVNTATGLFWSLANAAGQVWGAIWGTVTWWAGRVRDDVTGMFNGLVRGVSGAWEGLKGVIKGPVSWVADRLADAFGWLAGLPIVGGTFSGLSGSMRNVANWIRGWQAGAVLDWRQIGSGFATSRPVGVVGEGNRAWPEYVLPTDPKWRGRAQGLLLDYMRRVGIGMMQAGGSLGAWWQGSYPMTQGPGGSFSHANLNAWDYAMPMYTPLYAGVGGTIRPGYDPGGYGNFISFLMDQGGSVILGHLAAILMGGHVGAGAGPIAWSDTTGFSTGPHLHFEVRGSSGIPGQGGGIFRGLVQGIVDKIIGIFGGGGWGAEFGRSLIRAAANALLNVIPFDQGGIWPAGTLGVNRGSRPELVIPLGRGGPRVAVEVPVYLNGREIARSMAPEMDILGDALVSRYRLRSGFRGRR